MNHSSRAKRRSPIALALGLLAMSTQAQPLAEIDYRLSFPPDSREYQSIEPGQEGTFAFTITSTSPDQGPAAITGRFASEMGVFSEYLFVASDAERCNAPTVEPYLSSPRIVFTTGAVAPGESLTCSYRILRAETSTNAIYFLACGDRETFYYCQSSFVRGSLPDLALSLEQVVSDTPDSGLSVFRLRLDNLSGYGISGRVATTDCREFHGGVFDPVPYTLEGGFPGACPEVDGEGCLNFTGQNFDSFGFQFGAVPAGGSTSCLIRVRSRQGGQSGGQYGGGYAGRDGLHLRNDWIVLSNNGRDLDANSSNDAAEFLSMGVLAGIPMSRGAMVLLALLLSVVGLAMLRRRLVV